MSNYGLRYLPLFLMIWWMKLTSGHRQKIAPMIKKSRKKEKPRWALSKKQKT